MLCPTCRAGCAVEDTFCHRCGADLSVPSKSLVLVKRRVPTILHNPQVPRVAAGVGALAVGVGLELLRRNLLKRLVRPVRSSAKLVPALASAPLSDIFTSEEKRTTKLPKGYEIQETLVYMSRVTRRTK